MEPHIETLPPGTIIVHGAARGADQMAARIASRCGFATEPHPADWDRHGKAAGAIRNLEMLDSGIDRVLAFWDGNSRGTLHTITEAHRRGVPVEEHIEWGPAPGYAP
jgi:hypothetical protein